jgi:ferredoxin
MAYTITVECTGCTACVRPCPVGAISGEKDGLHTIDANLCIDCGACGLVCTFQAVLDARGHLCTFVKRSAWPKPVFDLALCNGCTECVRACPVSCLDLSLQRPRAKTPYPVLSRPGDCIACAFCRDACPLEVITMTSG